MKLISLLIFLVSCANLNSIDKPVCVEINMGRGYCTTIISGKGQFVDNTTLLNGKTWFDSRNDMIRVPVDTWKALKKYLIKNCKQSKKCNAKIDSWTRSMALIDEQLVKEEENESTLIGPPSTTNSGNGKEVSTKAKAK